MGWEPDAKQIAWARRLVQQIKDGGTWEIPATGNVYTFHHGPKEVHLISGKVDDWHHKNVILFSKIDYKVIDARKGSDTFGQTFGLNGNFRVPPSSLN